MRIVASSSNFTFKIEHSDFKEFVNRSVYVDETIIMQCKSFYFLLSLGDVSVNIRRK